MVNVAKHSRDRRGSAGRGASDARDGDVAGAADAANRVRGDGGGRERSVMNLFFLDAGQDLIMHDGIAAGNDVKGERFVVGARRERGECGHVPSN